MELGWKSRMYYSFYFSGSTFRDRIRQDAYKPGLKISRLCSVRSCEREYDLDSNLSCLPDRHCTWEGFWSVCLLYSDQRYCFNYAHL